MTKRAPKTKMPTITMTRKKMETKRMTKMIIRVAARRRTKTLKLLLKKKRTRRYSFEILINKNVYVHLRLRLMNINELLVRYINELLVLWWESERRIVVIFVLVEA